MALLLAAAALAGVGPCLAETEGKGNPSSGKADPSSGKADPSSGKAAEVAEKPVPAPVKTSDPAVKATAAPGGEKESPPPPVRPSYPTSSDLQKTEEEGKRLAGLLRSELEKGDLEGFSSTLFQILNAYPGDPSLLLEDFRDQLSSGKLEARQAMADAFLKMGTHREEAVAALREIVRQTDVQRLKIDGESYSPRSIAARTLAQYGATEAADDLWELYQQSSNGSLLTWLGRLGDDRPREIVKEAVKSNNVMSYLELVGKYDVKEAEAPLKAMIAARDQARNQPNYERYEAEGALFRITGDESHLQYLFDHAGDTSSLAVLSGLKTPEVQEFLQKLVLSGKDTVAQTAFIGLYASYPDDPVVRKVVVDGLELKNLNSKIGWDALLQVAVNMRDPEIDGIGQKFEDKVRDGSWTKRHNRRNWPFLNSLLD
ncbi:MAG: hypothetical protein JWO82_1778 [Akkermansiaceae bacterium]|nr:hypothetical protein [Akkermansiaceae bacterium]